MINYEARLRTNPWLHRVALLVACCTFPLIFLGGLVTSKHAGMSVPDWPNTYGYNMFLFPPRLWIGGIFYEHTHRLMASVVGVMSVTLTILIWKVEPRRWVRWLAVGVLVGVITQGVLGGLRVVLVKHGLAPIHACFAQAFFCLTVLMAIVTGRWWMHSSDLSKTVKGPSGRRLAAIAIAGVVIVYCQLIIGSVMRHYDAGLAIPDLPLAYGKIVPPFTSDSLRLVNQFRIQKLGWEPVTLMQIWIHFAHRIGAVIVTITLTLLIKSAMQKDHNCYVRSSAGLLALLLVTQLALGVATVLLRKPADIASLHVAVGALVLATTFTIAVCSMRLYSLRWRSNRLTSPSVPVRHAMAMLAD